MSSIKILLRGPLSLSLSFLPGSAFAQLPLPTTPPAPETAPPPKEAAPKPLFGDHADIAKFIQTHPDGKKERIPGPLLGYMGIYDLGGSVDFVKDVPKLDLKAGKDKKRRGAMVITIPGATKGPYLSLYKKEETTAGEMLTYILVDRAGNVVSVKHISDNGKRIANLTLGLAEDELEKESGVWREAMKEAEEAKAKNRDR